MAAMGRERSFASRQECGIQAATGSERTKDEAFLPAATTADQPAGR
jgi:hypothetical protein